MTKYWIRQFEALQSRDMRLVRHMQGNGIDFELVCVELTKFL